MESYKDTILFKIKEIDKVSRTSFSFVLSSYHLSGPQGIIILFVLEHLNTKLTQNDICNHFGIKGSTLNGILKKLEKNEYIIKQCNRKDKRYNFIVPTNNAINLKKVLDEKKALLYKQITQNFSREELDNLDIYLDRILTNLEHYGEKDI